MPPSLPIGLCGLEATPAPNDPAVGDRAAVRRKLFQQDDRDYELWSIVIVTLFFSILSLAVLVLPSVLWGLDVVEVRGRYLPQLSSGLVVLIVLLNSYVMIQKRELRKVRAVLVEQLARADDAVGRSLIDPLTELFNRRYLGHLLDYETTRTDRTGIEFALLMVDVNDFSTVNNKFGHLEGDEYLKQVADVLKRSFRKSDTVARYGGDEFVVVMPHTTELGARAAIDRLSAEVALWNVSRDDTRYAMSLSFGVAAYTKATEIYEVFELADRRMYEDKDAKRVSPRTRY